MLEFHGSAINGFHASLSDEACCDTFLLIVTRPYVAGHPFMGWHMPISREIGSGTVALGPPRPSPLTDPRLTPRSYPRRGRGSVRGACLAKETWRNSCTQDLAPTSALAVREVWAIRVDPAENATKLGAVWH
eukprot:6209600-Pleurochrysis_carterae.AAC.1